MRLDPDIALARPPTIRTCGLRSTFSSTSGISVSTPTERALVCTRLWQGLEQVPAIEACGGPILESVDEGAGWRRFAVHTRPRLPPS